MKPTSKVDPYGKLRKLTVKQLKEMVEGCRIVHDAKRARKADLVSLIEMCLIINGVSKDLEGLDLCSGYRDSGSDTIDTKKAKEKADRETLAMCHGWGSRYDSWYILYSYIAGQYQYGFAWETYYDEIHRGYSGQTVWYDALGQGTYFPVRYYNKDPKLHHAAVKKFEKLTMPFYSGRRRLDQDGSGRKKG